MTLQEALDQGCDIQSMNTFTSGASDDVYIRSNGKVYIHPMESSDIIITSLENASEALGYPLDSLEFDIANESGSVIIQYWLEENGLNPGSPENF